MIATQFVTKGVQPHSIVTDDNGNTWLALEKPRKNTQKMLKINYEDQRDLQEKMRHDAFSTWTRETCNSEDYFSELAFDYLHQTVKPGGATKHLSVSFFPHQLRALALFEGAAAREGLLIADEVGAGKTYSAGHIIHNGLMNGSHRRVLVLCPSNLSEKWEETLKKQFHLRCNLASSGNVLRRWLEGETNGFDIMISSYDKGRAKYNDQDMIDYLELAFANSKIKGIDLVIFDEIHNLIGRDPDTVIRRKLANLISLNSRSRVGLTATPIWKDVEDLSHLSDILRPVNYENYDFNNMMVKQRNATRAVNILRTGDLDSTAWINAWNELSDQITDSTLTTQGDNLLDFSRNKRIDFSESIALEAPFSTWITRTRSEDIGRLASRIIPNLDLVDLGENSLGEFYNPNNNTMVKYPSEREAVEELQELLIHFNHRLQLSSSPGAFHKHLSKLIEKNRIREDQIERAKHLAIELSASGTGSKENKLIEVIQDLIGRRKGGVLFTHWQPTFDRLIGSELGLENRVSKLKVYSAEYNSEEVRKSNVSEFLNHDDPDTFPLLIATDILSEGVDLQETADSIIHYDLPSNPQKVEQRIGRVDRLGQKSEEVEVRYILIRNFEDHVYLQAMSEKIDEFEENIGKMRPITPENFTSYLRVGGMSDSMREELEAWNLESIAGLDLRSFNANDLPESYRNRRPILFDKLASKAIYKSFRKFLPPSTTFDFTPEKVKIKTPNTFNIVSINTALADNEGERELKQIYNRMNQSLDIPIHPDGLLKPPRLEKLIMNIARQSSPKFPNGLHIIYPELNFERVEIYRINTTNLQNTNWFAISYLENQIEELNTREWQNLIIQISENESTVSEDEASSLVEPNLLENKLTELSQAEHVWERHRLFAEGRRLMAIASQREELGLTDFENWKKRGEDKFASAEGLDSKFESEYSYNPLLVVTRQ
ncbi:MAG: hypothetical protein CL734_06380 [Chloroflexi bacterium]|nr:hypothetical protein [Chloroflexota bacterium]